MATLFGSLTALVLALSLWIGYKNKAEYVKQIELRQKEERRLDGNTKTFNTTSDELKETTENKEATIAKNTELTEEQEELSEKVEGMESDIETKKSEIADNKATIESNDDVMKELSTAETLIPELTATQKKIAQIKDDIETEKGNMARLQGIKNNTAETITVKREIVSLQTSGKSLPTLNTTIRSVFANWGFVILNAGNAQGVVPGSTLDVLRGGEIVGQLKVTAVEQNRASADVVTEDLAAGVNVRPGDRVVAHKEEAAAAPVPAPAKEKATEDMPADEAPVADEPAAEDEPAIEDPSLDEPAPADEPEEDAFAPAE